jgi:putative peptidoglycan binding protein
VSITPTLAPSLVRARAAINAQWPHRDRSSDGWIGDAAHQATISDHNPDANGIVHAIDVDKDGIHVPTVLAGLLASPATHYVIHNRRIWQYEDHFKPRVYTGLNPHTGHIHESIHHVDAARYYAGPWEPIGGWKVPTGVVLKLGARGVDVRILQAFLSGHWYALAIDGDFGPSTDAAVRQFQRRALITVDGIAGPITRSKLATLPV